MTPPPRGSKVLAQMSRVPPVGFSFTWKFARWQLNWNVQPVQSESTLFPGSAGASKPGLTSRLVAPACGTRPRATKPAARQTEREIKTRLIVILLQREMLENRQKRQM